MNTIYEEDYKGYHINIELDDCDRLVSPREDDNLGTMVCWHRRYNLGDKQPKDDPIDYIKGLLEDYTFPICASDEYNLWAEEHEEDDCLDNYLMDLDDNQIYTLFREYYFVLPLNLYDHSGISMSTSSHYPYDDYWDAGQVGFIYVDKSTALKEFDNDEAKVYRSLECEVKAYDDYLTGNVFGYQVFELNEDEGGDYDSVDRIDSCWGFYPSHEQGERDYDYCLREARDIVDWKIKENKKKLWERAALEQPMGD